VKKVLVVDDSPAVRGEVGGSLRNAGFEVLEARDGVEGLEQIAQHRDLALAVLDVNMPVMNGIEMVERLHQDPQAAGLAFVMLTTEVESELIERAKKAGAKGWFVKPVRPDMLVMVARHLAGMPTT
jgi:two-component system chemotaxis response regulator CheY